MENEFYVCCICKKAFNGWGNNPYPVDINPDHKCCDTCNNEIVVPTRLEQLLYQKKRGVENGKELT